MLSLPYGISNAVIILLLPYILRKHGVPVEQIASVVAIANIPSVWFFAYSPVVDMGLQRRTWILIAAACVGVFSGTAILETDSGVTWVTALLFLGSAFAGILSTAMGALLTTLPADVRGRASGWYQAGNLGGGAVGGGVTIWLAERIPLPALAMYVAGLIVIPCIAVWFVHELPHQTTAFGVRVRLLVRDFGGTLKSPRTLTGLVFLLSPVGSAAVGNLISSVGPDYRASTDVVALISGVGGGLLSALGSLIGGYICDRIDVMKGYAAAGMTCAAAALYLGFAPHTPVTFSIGYSSYAVAAGFAYAVFTAMVLEILGPAHGAAGTSYSLLVASGNLPIIYMTWLDGLGYERWQARGLMTVDALGNGAVGLALLFFGVHARRVWMKSSRPSAPAT